VPTSTRTLVRLAEPTGIRLQISGADWGRGDWAGVAEWLGYVFSILLMPPAFQRYNVGSGTY
jgi:hypothetical protein